MVHCPVARRHLDGGSVRRIGALGVVVSLVALVSASAADGAGPGPAKDVFTAIVIDPRRADLRRAWHGWASPRRVRTRPEQCQGRAGNPAGAGGAGPRARRQALPLRGSTTPRHAPRAECAARLEPRSAAQRVARGLVVP